jgi:hypothetical protein
MDSPGMLTDERAIEERVTIMENHEIIWGLRALARRLP